MTTRCDALRVVLPALVAATVAFPAGAWTPATQIAIGESAASIAPPDLARQIDKHRIRFREGLVAPFTGAPQAAHVKNDSGSGTLDRSVVSAAQRAVSAIEGHQPFADVVYQLGVVAHFVADASNPLNASDADPAEPTYFADYLRYIDSARDRYPIVFYATGRDLRRRDDLEHLLDTSIRRSRAYYPLIGAEYERVGSIDGVALFDDRSTAFGIGSVAMSHAVSDVAAVLRFVWLEAGGGDRRSLGLTAPDSAKERRGR